MAHKTGADLVSEAKSGIRQVSPADLMSDRNPDRVYLDVREPNEWNLGRIPGAVSIPRGTMEGKVEEMIPRDKNVVVYCASGNRSALAAQTLMRMGYENVASMSSGFRGWADSGGEVES